VISGFRRDADENCAVLGYNAASSGNPLPTFQDNVSVPSSTFKKSTFWPLKMGPIRCPEMSVKDYHSTLRYTPEDRRSVLKFHDVRTWRWPTKAEICSVCFVTSKYACWIGVVLYGYLNFYYITSPSLYRSTVTSWNRRWHNTRHGVSFLRQSVCQILHLLKYFQC
jgi:hypothetical protein